jgi:quercetin dioxygenase-like cupin family protein
MTIRPLIEKLDRLDESFRSMEALFGCGLLTRGEVVQAGDWSMRIWSHSMDGAFSIGALERVRANGEPFPFHRHDQRSWVLCSKGQMEINFLDSRSHALNEGEYLVVAPGVSHSFLPLTRICVAVLVTIPSDPGLSLSDD